MKPADLGQAFLNHEAIDGVVFAHNDYVHILQGKHAGKSGSLVTVRSLEPEPLFIIELEPGFDVEVLQSEIALAD